MSDVKITGVETYIVANPWKPWVFVRVETNTGVHGIAEATLHAKQATVVRAINEMERYYLGADPFETERLWLEMYRDEAYSDNAVNLSVISAIDIACWDIKGKLLDKPLYELLGGRVHDEIRAYANGWYTEAAGDPAKFAAAAERVVADGYDAMKFDPFGSAWERLDRAALNRAEDIVAAVREAVGPDIDLLIEGHGRFTPGMAVEIADRLAPYDPSWFEEPTPADSINGLRKVADRSTIPIATGERHMSKHTFRDLLVDTDVDILQPDLANTGGITEGQKIAGLAEADHVSIAPHNPQGPVATAMYAHFDVATPNFMIQETFTEYDVEWAVDLLEDPIRIEQGALQLPAGPGLGVTLDMDAVREYAVSPDELSHDEHLNLFDAGWETRSLTDD